MKSSEKEFLRSLKDRGLDGIKLVISDTHKGLRNAIDTVMCTSWQRCRVHFMRDVLAHGLKNQHQMIASIIRTAFDQPLKEKLQPSGAASPTSCGENSGSSVS